MLGRVNLGAFGPSVVAATVKCAEISRLGTLIFYIAKTKKGQKGRLRIFVGNLY